MSFWNLDFWNSELSFEERGGTKTQHLDSYIPLYCEYDWKKPYIVKHKKCGGVIETCPTCGSADMVIDTASYDGRWNLVCRICFRKECQCGLKLAVNGMGKLDNTDRYSNDFIAILPNTISENPTIRGNREPTKFDATNILIHRGCGHKKTLCSFCGSEIAVCAYTGLIFCSQCKEREIKEEERKELGEKLAKENAKVARKKERQHLRESGKLSIAEEKMDNLIDELTDNDGPAYKLIVMSENRNKAVFARYSVYDLHGYKSISQDVVAYSILSGDAEIILECHHLSSLGCVSTKRDYIGGIEIKSVASVFASGGRLPSIFLSKDDTKIEVRWLDGTVENFMI